MYTTNVILVIKQKKIINIFFIEKITFNTQNNLEKGIKIIFFALFVERFVLKNLYYKSEAGHVLRIALLFAKISA